MTAAAWAAIVLMAAVPTSALLCKALDRLDARNCRWANDSHEDWVDQP